MINETKTVYGTRTTTNIATNGTVTSNIIVGQRKQQFGFRSVVTRSGDFKSTFPHSYVRFHREYWDGVTISKYPDGREYSRIEGLQSKTLVDNLPSDFSFNAIAYNIAVAELEESVRGTLDLSVDLVQWRQVFDMINIRNRGIRHLSEKLNAIGESIDRLDRISRRRVLRLRRGGRVRDIRVDETSPWYRRRARRLARYIAEKRLEYVYGWQPLAASIIDLGEEFCDPSRQSKGWLSLKSIGYVPSEYLVQVSANEKRLHNVFYKCVMTVNLLPHDNVLADQASRLSSLNPVSLLWETIPFSFVVDWFVDIGGWLRSTETAFIHGSRFHSGWMVEGYKGVCKGTEFYNTTTAYRDIKMRVEEKCYRRSSLSTYPFPRLPSFKMSLGPKRLLNAAALLAVNARRIDDFVARWR